jgi:NAD-dependent deacetylase
LRTKCFEENVVVEEWVENGELPPHCPRCGGLLRPDVVWFGEMLPHSELEQACQAARGCEIFFSVGTSALVQPAASLPYMAQESGAVVVEVNPATTPLTRWVDHVLQGPAGVVLPELVQAVWPVGS